MSPPYAYALEEEITGTKLIVSLTNRLTNKDSDFLCLCIGLRTHFWLILIMGIVRFKELLIMVDTCQASTLFSQVSLILHFYHSLKILCRFLWNNSLWSWFLSVHCPELINIEVHIGVQFYSVHIFFCYLYSSSTAVVQYILWNSIVQNVSFRVDICPSLMHTVFLIRFIFLNDVLALDGMVIFSIIGKTVPG